MSTLTGADLYRAFNAGDEDAVPWGSVSRDIQDLHICAAAIVQESHIEPLQHEIEMQKRAAIDIAKQLNAEIATRQLLEALVRDYVDFAKYDAPTIKRWADEWRAQRDQLAERAKERLGEEVN